MRPLLFITVVALALPASASESEQAPMVTVPAGTWRPLYPAEGESEVEVESFALDATPVTNAQFAGFVRTHEQWQRGRVPELFAGSSYLRHWPTAMNSPAGEDEFPVTNVSWWAARAYCEARDARLPTLAEWELAAAASESAVDGSSDPAFAQKILGWYSQPTKLHAVGTEPANVFGVHDMHGLIWEWVEDFQAELIVVDNRADGTVDPSLFCGTGAVGAVRKEDYAAFMRSAFRSSLVATHTTQALGFRCASDAQETP